MPLNGKVNTMAKESFKANAELENALSLMLEQEPTDWGAAEHATLLRYGVLACSDKASLPIEAVRELKDDATVTVNWGKLKRFLYQGGKLVECANFKKWLMEQEDWAHLGKKEATKYA